MSGGTISMLILKAKKLELREGLPLSQATQLVSGRQRCNSKTDAYVEYW